MGGPTGIDLVNGTIAEGTEGDLVIGAFGVLLMGTTSGRGEAAVFAGMVLLFRLYIMVPVLLMVNGGLMWRNWQTKRGVLICRVHRTHRRRHLRLRLVSSPFLRRRIPRVPQERRLPS